jgi:hypothetical protein
MQGAGFARLVDLFDESAVKTLRVSLFPDHPVAGSRPEGFSRCLTDRPSMYIMQKIIITILVAFIDNGIRIQLTFP